MLLQFFFVNMRLLLVKKLDVSMSQTRLTSLEGNAQWLDGGAMFGNVPKPLWQRWVEVDEKNRIKLACRSLLIEIEGRTILCEAGIGAFFEPKLAERFGVEESEHVLLRSLKSFGIQESAIDYVILSHLHFDHAGGLLPTYDEIRGGDDRLLFPNARYIVGKRAFERALAPHPRDKASYIPGLTDKLRSSDRLVIIEEEDGGGLVSDRLSFRFTDGHTPGQMHTVFRGDKRTVIFAGDLIPGTPWVHLPITMGYDRFPEKLIDEKQELYNLAHPENWLVFYTHDSRFAASGIKQNDLGKYEATDSWESLESFEI